MEGFYCCAKEDSMKTAKKHFPAITYYEMWILKGFSITNIVIGQMSPAYTTCALRVRVL